MRVHLRFLVDGLSAVGSCAYDAACYEEAVAHIVEGREPVDELIRVLTRPNATCR